MKPVDQSVLKISVGTLLNYLALRIENRMYENSQIKWHTNEYTQNVIE